MSVGRRSGVHCTRLNEQPTLRARARASMVLATPGTSSSNRCPSQKKPTTDSSSCGRLPTITFSTLPTIFDAVTATVDMRFSHKRKAIVGIGGTLRSFYDRGWCVAGGESPASQPPEPPKPPKDSP